MKKNKIYKGNIFSNVEDICNFKCPKCNCKNKIEKEDLLHNEIIFICKKCKYKEYWQTYVRREIFGG